MWAAHLAPHACLWSIASRPPQLFRIQSSARGTAGTMEPPGAGNEPLERHDEGPSEALSAKERKRRHRWEQKNRWMPHYELKYGVAPVELGGGSAGVVRAKCRFCESFGRELAGAALAADQAFEAAEAALLGPPGAKRRKKRQTLKVFGPNFRTDNLESHLSREHPARWREYERLKDADKRLFFPDAPPQGHEHAAAFASSLGLALGPASLMLLPGQTPPVRAATAADAANPSGKMLALSLGLAAGNGPAGGIVVALAPAVLELLNQLLANQRCKSSGLEPDAPVAPNLSALSWHHFVRSDEALDGKHVTLSALAADRADGSLEIRCAEPILSFAADAFAAGLDLEATIATLVATQRLGLFDLPQQMEVTLEFAATAVRNIVAVNFSNLSQLMATVWGYALVLRVDTEHSSGYVDVRVHLPMHDEIHDLHVLAIPVDAQRHNTESLGAAVVKALVAADPLALQKIVGVTVDGDPFHMKGYLNVAAWIRRRAAGAIEHPGSAFYVLHSAPFLLSNVVEDLLEICETEFDFYATLLQVEALAMSSTARGRTDRSGVIETLLSLRSRRSRAGRRVHWIEVYDLCHWCAIHRESLVRLYQEKQQASEGEREGAKHVAWSPPSNVWWALVFVFRDLLKDILSVYTKCGNHSTSFSDVQRHLRELVFQLRLKFNIKPSDLDASASGDTIEAMSLPPQKKESTTESAEVRNASDASAAAVAAAVADSESFSVDPSDFSYQDFVSAVIHLDMFMYEAFHAKSVENFSDSDRATVYQRFNVLLLLLISKLQTVTAVSADSSSSGSAGGGMNASGSGAPSSEDASFADLQLYGADIPPSTPYELITINNLTFMELLDSQQARIRAKWSGKVVSMITEDRNRMVTEFAERGEFYDAITAFAKQQHQGDVTFRDAWRACMLEFPSLCSFAAPFGALLAVAQECAGGGSRKRTWDSNLLLEGFLHGQQLHTLAMLRKRLDALV